MQTEQFNPFREAAETIYELLQDDNFRKQCEARQKYLDRQRETYDCIDTAKDRRTKAETETNTLQSKISSLNLFIAEAEKNLATLRATPAGSRS